MIENYIYDTGYMPEQYIMSYQIKDNSDYTKSSKHKKNKKHGVNNNKHLSPALVPHHHYHGHYHGASDPYSHGYYSDITGYPMHEHYGVIKDKKQRDKSASRQPKEEKDSSYLGKFMTLGRKKQNKNNKPKDNEDIYAIPRPSLVPGEPIQRSTILRNMRVSTGQISERKGGGMVNSKSMSNLHARGQSKGYTGTRRSSSSGSSEEIYESMEDIRSRKTILNAVMRAQQTRAKKTGHPLFDHLRAKSQEDILRHERSMSPPQNLRCSQERIPQPVWPKADPYSKHAYHYIDDSSDIYSSSNDELEYKPETNRPRIHFQNVPDSHPDEMNEYDDVYSVPRFADSANRKFHQESFADSASRKFHQEMRAPEMRYH